MQSLITHWEEVSDQRAIFLTCYCMMTRNMLLAIDGHEFINPSWVDKLLHRFADYYFNALNAYEQDPVSAPAVWQQAHNMAPDPHALALNKLLLGVNAHINYDLVFALVDLLRPEWASLTDNQRAERYADHCHVNDIIGRTIDSVQDQVLEPAMPLMEMIDNLFGPFDEMLISRLIGSWRETVWQNATHLLETQDPIEQDHLTHEVEEATLRVGERFI